MADGYKVEKRRLERHAAWLDGQREEWDKRIPGDLHGLFTTGGEFTAAGDNFVAELEGLREKYANDIVPGVCSLMAEVVAALRSVKKNYGDAEEASTVAHQGERLPQHQTPGNDLGQILNQGTR
ncbi:hypothetical protein [Actinoallomurus sp. NPDC050550]|uniref:hypothetical protein n=1 Tax=Actinoallomurus sp. NPDC050550 TaxID=3154937 RepID=UPI0033CCBD41